MSKNRILVLGMHRSGTSATMAALKALGAYIGDEDALTEKNWENPQGFFERKDMRAICDTLLHSANADWWKVSGFQPKDIPSDVLQTQKETLKALIGELDAHGIWALKEPRLSILLPALEEVLDDAVILWVNRHPLEVAKSLRKRNGYGLHEGLALWELYQRRVVAQLIKRSHIRVNYEQLIENSEASLQKLAKDLQAAGVAVSYNKNITDVIASELRREEADDVLLKQIASEDQLALWNALKSDLSIDEIAKTLGDEAGMTSTLSDLELKVTNDKALKDKAEAQRKARIQAEEKLTETKEKYEAELERLNALIAKRDTDLEAMKSSTSWKITAPLRKLKP